MKVVVVGTGYVGLPTGAVLADLGHEVVCVDKDSAKVEKIRNAESPIYEPGLIELLRKVLDSGRFTVQESLPDALKGAEVAIIAVGTPSGEDGRPNMSFVRAVAEEIGQNLDHPIVVVNKSTVPIGSGEMVRGIIIEAGADPAHVSVASCPEFLREGSAVKDSYNPDRVVIGAETQEAADKLIELYKPLDAPIFVTDVKSAELIKYASNSFLATKISFINAISRVCELSGADVDEVAKGMGMDARIGADFLKAGLGWGGSCFPKDVKGLISKCSDLGYDFEMLTASSNVNDDQTKNFLRRLKKAIGSYDGKKVALLGLAFKPNTDDIRDAKSLEIIDFLKSEGADISAYDPAAMTATKAIHPDIEYAQNAYETTNGADAVIVVTEWGEFRALDLNKLGDGMRQKVMFDGRRVFDPEDAEAAGFKYARVGSMSEFDGIE